MLNLRYFLKLVEPDIKSVSLDPKHERFEGLMSVLEPQDHYEGGRLYILGACMELPPRIEADDDAVFLFCDGMECPCPPNCSAIYLNTPFPRVFNELVRIKGDSRTWEKAFDDLEDPLEFETIVSLAARLGDCPAVMINDQGKIICSDNLRKSRKFSNDVPNGSLPLDVSVKRIAEALMRGSQERMDFKSEEGVTVFCRRVDHPDGKVSIMVMEDDGGARDIETLTELAARKLDKLALSESLKKVHDEMRVFLRCWEDIMSTKVSTTVAVRDSISRLPHEVYDFVSLAVITFPDRQEKVPYRNILLQLRRFFPHENITLYQRDIVIMLSQKERSFRPNFESVDVDELSKFLIANNAMMAVSSKSRRVDGLPAMYSLTKRAALIATALNDSVAQSHIIYYEDYSIYCLIDLAVKQYLQEPENHDVVYLVHAAVIQLTRYDAEHNTNLRDVLYHYLTCDRNLVKTAAATFMHRNTVLNKINKITSLLNLDLDDERLRQKLILSCQVILYIERVMNISLKL